MTNSFFKPCNHCGKAIEISDIDGSYRAYNEDKSYHYCCRGKQ